VYASAVNGVGQLPDGVGALFTAATNPGRLLGLGLTFLLSYTVGVGHDDDTIPAMRRTN
jgi:hypothetical protein